MSNTREELQWYGMFQDSQLKLRKLSRQLDAAIDLLETATIPAPHVQSAKEEIAYFVTRTKALLQEVKDGHPN